MSKTNTKWHRKSPVAIIENQMRFAKSSWCLQLLLFPINRYQNKTHKDYEGHGFMSLMQSDIPERFSHFDLLGPTPKVLWPTETQDLGTLLLEKI